MAGYTAMTPIATFVNSRAAAEFEVRGVCTLGELQSWHIAAWWRIARSDFNALARGAAQAGVRPRGDAPIEQLLHRPTRSNLVLGLRKLRTDQAEAVAVFLTAEDVTSLLLVSALTRRDLSEISGMESKHVRFLVTYLEGQNVYLAQR
jgi:hypothetical protein